MKILLMIFFTLLFLFVLYIGVRKELRKDQDEN